MADLVMYMLQDTALDLLLDPWSAEEEDKALMRPLPEPMYTGVLG